MPLIGEQDQRHAVAPDIDASPALPSGVISTGPEANGLDQTVFSASMAALGPFEDRPFLAVAVSGGADSMALSLLADGWAERRGGRVVGLTVDHGLRSGSLEDARRVGRWLEARRIEHHILRWTGDKPTTGLQRRAREARYALLADWCRRHHCLHLLLGHHRGDQAETVALRKARQSGKAGLAAMAAVRELRGLRLLRPLLGVDKGRLEATLRAKGQPWLDDPSNASPAFARNRLRHAGLDVEALADEARRHGLWRQEADQRAAQALVQHVIIDPAGFATLAPRGFADLPDELALDLLTRLLMTIGGRRYPPRRRSLTRLFDAMRATPPTRIRTMPAKTLAHCRILGHRTQRPGDRDRWLFVKEGVTQERLPLAPGSDLRWDDRFVARLRTPLPDLAIGALGNQARLGEKTLILKGKSRHLPGAVKPVLPSIWREGQLIAIPHLDLYDASLAPGDLDLRFCPHSPLANAPFLPHIVV